MMSMPRRLGLVRLPGEFGPILRCSGELSVATAEPLRRELDLLMPLGHRVLTLNLSGCASVDVDGILMILNAFKQLRAQGRRLVVIAGPGRTARLLDVVGISQILPVFPTEEAAGLALRGGGPPEPAPESWVAARDRTVARWRAIQEALEHEPKEEILRQLTSLFALCESSEELLQEAGPAVGSRCQFCPLFYALGGRPQDVGCRSVLDPIVEAVRTDDVNHASAQIGEVIRTLEEMPLPEGRPDTGRRPA